MPVTTADALVRLRPGASFVARALGTPEESIEWLDEEQSQPTKRSITAMVAMIKAEQPWIDLRITRNKLLRACDWTDLPSTPLSEAQKADWQQYRQELRDVPQQGRPPDAVVWPDTPDVQLL